MQAMKADADLLIALQSPLSSEDLTHYILKGLDETCQSVIDGVHSCDSSISFEELHEKLIIKELSLKIDTP